MAFEKVSRQEWENAKNMSYEEFCEYVENKEKSVYIHTHNFCHDLFDESLKYAVANAKSITDIARKELYINLNYYKKSILDDIRKGEENVKSKENK